MNYRSKESGEYFDGLKEMDWENGVFIRLQVTDNYWSEPVSWNTCWLKEAIIRDIYK